jgi:hypothetical protein
VRGPLDFLKRLVRIGLLDACDRALQGRGGAVTSEKKLLLVFRAAIILAPPPL